MVGVVEGLLADDAFLLHLQIAVEGGLVHGQVGGGGVHLVLLDVGFVGADIGLGGGQLRALRVHLRHDFLLIELRQLLALVDLVVDVDVELFDDAGGLGFDLDLGDGLDFAGGHDRAGDVAALDLGDAVGVDLGAFDQAGGHNAQHQHNQRARRSRSRSKTLCFSLTPSATSRVLRELSRKVLEAPEWIHEG